MLIKATTGLVDAQTSATTQEIINPEYTVGNTTRTIAGPAVNATIETTAVMMIVGTDVFPHTEGEAQVTEMIRTPKMKTKELRYHLHHHLIRAQANKLRQT